MKQKKRNKFVWIFFGLIIILAISGGFFLTKKNKRADEMVGGFEHPQTPVVDEEVAISLGAQSFIVVDVDTNIILAQKKVDLRVYPASTTKLVTAMTALNVFPLDETVKTEEFLEGKNMGLVNDDELTVRDLVEAILIHSANDAAHNLAKHHSGGVAGFIAEMNKLVKKNGLKNTHFTNFDGIHDQNHYSSAYDLAQIARLALKNKVITESAKIKSKKITSKLGNKYFLETTNELLGSVAEIEGLKTGWTPEAGGCFIGLIRIGDKLVLSVILNSQDRFADTKTVVDWLKKSVSWQDYLAEI